MCNITFGDIISLLPCSVQKISPDTKEKVQLQLVMHNNEANTFHFRSKAGRPAQVADREKVKELLQKLLPQFRSKINSELEMKHKYVSGTGCIMSLTWWL